MAKKLQAIKTVDKLKALAQKLSEDIESQSEKLSDETKDEILSLIDRFLSLASNLPTELMLHADEVEEGTFTIAFLEQLSDEQLAELKEAVELHKDEDVFLYFYTRKEGKRMPTIELKGFEDFDFERVLETTINGNTVSHLQREDSPPIHYVSVTFTVA